MSAAGRQITSPKWSAAGKKKQPATHRRLPMALILLTTPTLPPGAYWLFFRDRLRRNPELAAGRLVVHHHRLAVANLALEQEPAERRLNLFLDRPLERPSTVNRVI